MSLIKRKIQTRCVCSYCLVFLSHKFQHLTACFFKRSRLQLRHLFVTVLLSDLFKYRFVNCKLINSTFLHNKEGCMLDFSDDFNNAYMIYFVNFLGTLAVLPGNIVSALLMDKIGRLRMLGRKIE